MFALSVVGICYAGLLLAVGLGRKHRTIVFALSPTKVDRCPLHCDPAGEVSTEEFKAAAIVGAVADCPFKQRSLTAFLAKLLPDGVIADVKFLFDPTALAACGIALWRL